MTCNIYIKYCRIWEGCCCLDSTCVNLTQQELNKNLDQYYIILNSVYHQFTYLKNFSYDISTTTSTCYPKFSLVILFTIRLAIPEKRVKFSMHCNNYCTKYTCTQLILRYLHRQIFNILFCPQNLSSVSSDDVICISGVLFWIYLGI